MESSSAAEASPAPQRPSPPVSAVFLLPALLPLLLTSTLAAPLPAQPALIVEPGAVVATGMTPGGEVAWLAVWRVPLGWSQRVGAVREVTPVDAGGEARQESPESPGGVPRRSIWVAVDLASGEFAVATPVTSAPGLTAHKEPATGRFVAPPPGVSPAPESAAAAPALSRESIDLVEEAGTTAAGGVRVSLQGRFRSRLVARRGEDGRLVVRCQPEPVAGAARPGAEGEAPEDEAVPSAESEPGG